MADDPAISIRGLFKIFGPHGAAMVDKVRGGMSKAELQAEHGHVLALDDVDLDIAAGGIQVIMGLSGSGKSTLIRHINRLIEPSSGEIVIEGEDVLAMSTRRLREFRRQRASMVFQRFGLMPHKTVLDNVAYGLEVAGRSRADLRQGAMRWIDRVGLNGYEQSYPAQLSGGMQQRVGLARALATDAPILLMDEAFSALDPLIRSDMQSVLLGLQKELRKTIVFITHDLDEALRLGDRISILREGAIIQEGTGQDIVLEPAGDYIASFVREVNRGRVVKVERIMEPRADHDADGGETISIPEGTVLEEAARLMTSRGVDRATVVSKTSDDRPLGRLSLSGLVSAMVTPVSKD